MSLTSQFQNFAKTIMPYLGLTDQPVSEQVDNIIVGGVLGTLGALAGGYFGGSLGVAVGGFALNFLGNKYGDSLMPKAISLEHRL